MTIAFDRRVDDSFAASFGDGDLRWVTDWALSDPVRDVQLRKLPGKAYQEAALYIGLTCVLYVRNQDQSWWFGKPHKNYAAADRARFDSEWGKKVGSAKTLSMQKTAVLSFIERIPTTWHKGGRTGFSKRWIEGEGRVHGALASWTDGRVMFEREADCEPGSDALWITREREKAQAICAEVASKYEQDGKGASSPWPSGSGPSLGRGVDFLGVDDAGRLLVVEAKPNHVSNAIGWAPIQVALYERIFNKWAMTSSSVAEIVNSRLRTRRLAGLISTDLPILREGFEVAAIAAVGPGEASPMARERFESVRSLLIDRGYPPCEYFEVA